MTQGRRGLHHESYGREVAVTRRKIERKNWTMKQTPHFLFCGFYTNLYTILYRFTNNFVIPKILNVFPSKYTLTFVRLSLP